MALYRITVEKIDLEPDVDAKWQSHVHADGRSDYARPPEGSMRKVSEKVFDQTVEDLDLAGMVRAINTPDAFKA